MLIRNATLADGRTVDVRIAGEVIDAVGTGLDADSEEKIDASGKRIMPGMIDVHVHFRQPGHGHKETWRTGSKSAVAGGVTTVVDQPNTTPPTVDGSAFDEKERLAAESLVDFGINGGVTADWDPQSLFDRPLFALGEVFLADSTGEMGIEPDLFGRALDGARDADVPVTVHAEDATAFDESVRGAADADAWSRYRTPAAEKQAVEHACRLATDREISVHIAHTSTPEGIDVAANAGMTCEVTPHHLFLSRENLDELGTFGRMNPPLRSEQRREAVFDRVIDGTVDVIATDHAPHTRAEKDASIWDAPSGVPGVETALPLLLAAVTDGSLPWERVRDLTARRPAEIFDLPRKGRIEPGAHADLVLVDPERRDTIRADRLHTKVDWTPFEGQDGLFPEWTMCRGTIVYRRETDEFVDHPGENVRRH